MTNANPVSTTSREEHPAQRDGIYKRFMISKKCPGCGSRNVRRSKRIAGEMTWKRNFLSPYRCRDCKKRFSVVSTKIHYRFWMAGLAIAAGIIFWREYPSMDYPFLRPEPPVSAGKIVADATKLAEKRDPAAEYTLSQIYAQGDGVAKNSVQARGWLKRAAEHGNVEAQYDLGMALREGRDVVQDYQGAFKWLGLAAENGHTRAQFELGHMYRVGIGTPVDNVKAYTWFNLAAARGHEEADRARIMVLPLLSRADVIEAQKEALRWTEARNAADPLRLDEIGAKLK